MEQEFRGKKYRTELLTKAKIEIVANDEDVDRIVNVIRDAALTGKGGRQDLRLRHRRRHPDQDRRPGQNNI